MVDLHQALNIVQVLREGLRSGCRGAFRLTYLGCAAPAKDEAQPQALGFFEEDLCAVEGHAWQVQVMMVGHRAAAGTGQLHQPDPCGQAETVLIEQPAIAIGHGPQPGTEALVDASGNALEQGLEQMVMGVHPAWIHHAIGGIEHLLTW
ncbi:hypothetical protein D9M71_328720 [compost metagenome]